MNIIVSAFSNLNTDQRIGKICQTLWEEGHSVYLIGCTWGDNTKHNTPYPNEKIKIISKSLKTAYPEFNIKLYKRLRHLADNDTILYCNDLDALLANYILSKKLSIPLIYDSHEIYTEMPAIQGKISQKIWRFLERKIIPNIRYMITASNSYADWFVKKYKIKRPTVVQNFPKLSFSFYNTENNPKIVLYQGVLNPSRGLDKIIQTLPMLENVILYIAGDGPIKEMLKKIVKKLSLENKVHFLGKIPPKDLAKITQKADIGLSIEENNGLSYYYSLPNKISDYIQSGVPILTSNFPEMANIVQKFSVGSTINNHSPEEIKTKITAMLNIDKEHYKEALHIAANELCWENEAKKLLYVIHQVKKENFG